MDALLPKDLDYKRVLKYVYGEQNEQLLRPIIDEQKNEVYNQSSPKVVYKIFDEIPAELISGSDIKKHLEGCYGLLLFCVTLGANVDVLIRKTKLKGALTQLVTDAVSSVLIEQVCEEFEKKLAQDLKENGVFITSSYACGYGDYPLSMLPLQLTLLDAHRKIGVGLTSDGFMVPRKSICACIGLSKKQVTGFRAGCEHCKMKDNCKLKKEGKTCVR